MHEHRNFRIVIRKKRKGKAPVLGEMRGARLPCGQTPEGMANSEREGEKPDGRIKKRGPAAF